MSRAKLWIIAPLAASAMFLSGCIFMRSSAISESIGKGTPISAQAEDMGYLVLIPPGDVTKMASDQLANQCQSGKITNVQTEMTVRDFFSIVQDYQVSANGVCM